MPTTSKSQFRYMQGVAHGSIKSPGLSKDKAQEFIDATPSYKDLPEKKGDGLAAHRKKLGLRAKR